MANSIKLNETKKYHFIYKTTNLLNGKYYIGMHSTNDIKDGYLGSGTILRRSIRKYGKQNFQCEILEYCNTSDLLKQREKELVTEESIKDILCMNLKKGGIGGFEKEHYLVGSKLGNERKADLLKTNDVFREKFVSTMKQSMIEAWKNGKFANRNTVNGFKGKTHSEETKLKMSLAAKNRIIK